jgi:hypothetical protein
MALATRFLSADVADTGSGRWFVPEGRFLEEGRVVAAGVPMALATRSSRLGPAASGAWARGAVTVRGAELVGLSMALAMRDSRVGTTGSRACDVATGGGVSIGGGGARVS